MRLTALAHTDRLFTGVVGSHGLSSARRALQPNDSRDMRSAVCGVLSLFEEVSMT